MKRASTAIVALILAALAIFILIPKLSDAADRLIGASISSMQARVESVLGLSFSFHSLSPSILRYASFSQLEISAPGGRKILSARKVRVLYDVLAILRGKGSEAFWGLDLQDVTINLSLPEDKAMMDSVVTLFGGGQGASAVFPKLSISGKNVSANLAVEGSGTASFEARTLSFSTANGEPTISLDGNFEVESPIIGPGSISGPLDVSGSLARDFKSARFALSLAADGRDFSLSTQRFELVYGNEVLALTKVKDRAPLDASIRMDFNGGESSIALMLDGFIPSKSLRLSGRYASLEPWLELPYKGSLVLKAPGFDPARIAYEAKLSGYLPSSFLPGDRPNARAEIDARGDMESMKIERAHVAIGRDSFDYAGSFRFADLSPDGNLTISLSLADGSLDASSSVRLLGHEGEYAAFADQAIIGGAVFRDIAFAASRKGEQTDFRLSFKPPRVEDSATDTTVRNFSGEAGAEAGMPLVSCEGSIVLGSNPNIELSVDLEALDLDPLKSIIAALSDSPDAASILSSLKLGGSLFVSSDFNRFSWSAPDLTVVSNFAPGAYCLLSLSGTPTSIAVKRARVSASGYSVEGSGKIDLSEVGRLGFEASISLKNIPYALRGSITNQGLSITGDYGLEISARHVDEDFFISAKAAGLPLPLGKGLFLATIDAEGRFASLQNWSLSIADSTFVPTGEEMSVIPEISLAGDFQPTAARIGRLRVADKVSALVGDAILSYSLSAPLKARIVAHLSADGQAKGASPLESYAIDASYSEGRLEGAVDLIASPLARLGKLAVDGSVDGRIAVKGVLSDPSIDFALKLRDGHYMDQTIALDAAGSYSDGALALRDVSAAYQGQNISKGFATFAVADASTTVSFDYAGTLSDESLKFSLTARGTSTHAGGTLGEMLGSYKADGSIMGFALGSALGPANSSSWPFSASVDERSLSFVGGNSGEVRFKYANGGVFSASLRDPFPVRADVAGLFDGKNIDLSVQGIEFDLALLEPVMPATLIKIVSGKARGGFRAVGLANDPEISGAMELEGASLKVLGWLADDAGPFNAPIIATGRKVSVSVPSIQVGKAAIALDCQASFDHWIPVGLTAWLRTLGGSKVRLDSIILGIHAQGDAAADLKFALQGDVLALDCDVDFDKGVVVVSPAILSTSAAETTRPQLYLAVATNVRFGRGVQVYFPSSAYPVVTGYSDPSSLLAIRYDQASEDYTLKGSVVLRGGEVFYIQRNFFIKNGMIAFNEGRDHFDPRVSLLAELRDRNDEGPITITLTAENAPITSFQPRLSSDPPMTESQIALLMGQNLIGASSNGSLTGDTADAIRKAVISTSDLFIPQLNVTRVFEDKVREISGLDMFYFRTQVLQNWLIDLSSPTPTTSGNALSRYFDQTELYAGKYLNDLTFTHASLSLIGDPLAGSNTLTLNSSLGMDFELGVELDSPFGLIQWNVDPKTYENQLIVDQSLSLSWKFAF